MKASYETDNGDDEDQTDETDDSYFTMKVGDHFFATVEVSNENQGGADGDNGYDVPLEALKKSCTLGKNWVSAMRNKWLKMKSML